MEIASIRHETLRLFAETGEPKGLPPAAVDSIRNLLAYLVAVAGEEELTIPSDDGAHKLSGDRARSRSLVVTRNRRRTFRIDGAGAIEDLDLEDCH